MLKWAQSQTGQLSFDPEKVMLSSVMLDVIELKKPLWKPKEIRVDYNTTDDYIAYADENMLRLVLRNLISTAVKLTGLGGQITLSNIKKDDHIEV